MLERLAARKARHAARVEWLGDQFQARVRATMRQRITAAAQVLRDQVVINLGIPVIKRKSARTGRITVDPTSRSKPGEFPRADTTRLMKDIFWKIDERHNEISATVGTSLDYGLRLETKMNRSFLRRTFREMLPQLRRILLPPGGTLLTRGL